MKQRDRTLVKTGDELSNDFDHLNNGTNGKVCLAPSFGTSIGSGLLRRIAFLGMAILISGTAQATTWILERADTPQEVTEAQAAEWEVKAREGDWQLKMEFAAAYLFDTFYPNFGCKALKYGHRCRAMAKRPQAGHVFLREVIDTEPKNHVEKVNIRNFQKYYAASLRYPAFILEPGSEACRDKVHYYEQALKNEAYCVGLDLDSMARKGLCMAKSEERTEAYRSQIPPLTSCPNY